MTPVFQSITDHDPSNARWGDCLRACVASLFDKHLYEVPHFCDESIYPGEYGFVRALGDWLAPMDLAFISFPVPAERMQEQSNLMKELGLDAYHLIGGRGPLGISQHIVVARYCEIVHDPWPKIDAPFRGTLTPDDNGAYELWMFVKRFVYGSNVLRPECGETSCK